jgi:DNA-binding HxlR family transcriptional regulator
VYDNDMQTDWLNYSRSTCSIAATLELIGEKWSLEVLREAFLGLRRFDDILGALGCARSVLTERLATLVAHGILKKVPYREPGSRSRYEYALTAKGRELFPILVALRQWGDDWNAPAGKPSLLVRHVGCKAGVRAEIRCTKGHGPLQASDVYSLPGPGAIRIA